MTKPLIYTKAQAMQEAGGRTWRVADGLVKHSKQKATWREVAGELTHEAAMALAESINAPRRRVHAKGLDA